MDRDASPEPTGSVVEATLTVTDSDYPFVGVSERESCRFELAEMVPRQGERYAEFFNVTGADPTEVAELATDHETVDVTLLAEYEDGGLFEFVVAGDCPAFALAELGALPREIESEAGEGRIVVEVPARRDVSAVVEAFLAGSDDRHLDAIREKESVRPLFSSSAFSRVLHDRLTDRQREVLATAFEAGYYAWPREATGEEVADELGITSATFSEHVHAAERKLLRLLFEESSMSGA